MKFKVTFPDRSPIGVASACVGLMLMIAVAVGALLMLRQPFEDLARADLLDGPRKRAGFEFERIDQILSGERLEAAAKDRLLQQVRPPDLLRLSLHEKDGRTLLDWVVRDRSVPEYPLVPGSNAERLEPDAGLLRVSSEIENGRYRAEAVMDVSAELTAARLRANQIAWMVGASWVAIASWMLGLLVPPLRRYRTAQALARADRDRLADAQHQLEHLRSEDLVRQLAAEADPDAVALCNEAGRIVWLNAAAASLWGQERDTLLGRPVENLIAPKCWPVLREILREMKLRREVEPLRDLPVRAIVNRQGEHVPVQLRAGVIMLRGDPVLYIHAEDPLVEAERTQRLQQAIDRAESLNSSRIRFLAEVSHEIRTPLNGLTGMLDLLEYSAISDRQREYVNLAQSSAKQLRMLLNDLLELSKIEADKLVFEHVPFDVEEQLGDTVRVFAAAAQQRGLSLGIRWNVVQKRVLGDPHRIAQILNNLLDNALKFTRTGGITVAVHTRTPPAEPSRCELQVEVADTGIGVPPDRIQAIFDPFAQAEESTTRRFGGTGLGLALCRQLCERMGGRIRVDPRPGGGSVFTFHVMCDIPKAMLPRPTRQPSKEKADVPLRDLRVLVVDDNRTNQTLLTAWLELADMRPTVVGDGAAAIEAVKRQEFDVVLMDVSMPVMDGLEATRAIRALALPHVPETRRFASLPVIGVSARAMPGDREACLASGMNGYVTKPIDRSVLFASLARVATGEPVTQEQAMPRPEQPHRLVGAGFPAV